MSDFERRYLEAGWTPVPTPDGSISFEKQEGAAARRRLLETCAEPCAPLEESSPSAGVFQRVNEALDQTRRGERRARVVAVSEEPGRTSIRLDMTSPGEIRREREGLHPYYLQKARSRSETLSCCLVVLGVLLVGTLVAWLGWTVAGVWR